MVTSVAKGRSRSSPTAASMWLSKPMSAAIGLVLDGVVAEPPSTLHPVRLFGRCMERVEVAAYRDTRASGIAHVAVGTGLGLAGGAMVSSTAAATCIAVAGRELRRVALSIGVALEGKDLERARELLPSLVGRDVATLDASDMARAVVESVAENTVDAVVAPALWGAVAGAPGAFGYRAVNTMDSMVGYRNDRYLHYGWASARLDDVAAFVPARLTALFVVLVRPRSAWSVRRARGTPRVASS